MAVNESQFSNSNWVCCSTCGPKTGVDFLSFFIIKSLPVAKCLSRKVLSGSSIIQVLPLCLKSEISTSQREST